MRDCTICLAEATHKCILRPSAPMFFCDDCAQVHKADCGGPMEEVSVMRTLEELSAEAEA